MKLCLTLAALIALSFVGQCEANERPSLSLITVRGYVYSAGRWQQHICRTLPGGQTQRVVQTSPTGAPHQLGHTVRCHHGVVFVPGDPNRRVMTAPNRSSRFVPRAAHRTLVITWEIHRDRFDLGDVLPSRPPYRGGGGPSSPVVERPPIETDHEIVLVLIEENRVLRSAPYRLPPPPLFPSLSNGL
jgi:hypothetical protein